jgi:hypothetical protein
VRIPLIVAVGLALSVSLGELLRDGIALTAGLGVADPVSLGE